jgi:rare lipoprotein A
MHLFAILLSAMASWYGPGLYGNNLGCGGRLTTSTFGVAHKYLRCGTRLVICYRRCRSVTVIDRGPYVAGREFDLTNPVRVAIGAPYGVFRVRYRIINGR